MRTTHRKEHKERRWLIIGFTLRYGSVMVGKTISHYRILQHLGGGGMGVVYAAEDLHLGRKVALKFLPPDLSRDPSALERFRREASASSALNHPNICTIYDIDSGFVEDGESLAKGENLHFIAMELLDGQSLKQQIEGRPFEVNHLLEMAIQIADALHVAHSEGIIHRDIKPGNIFISRHGQAKILDFGLAKLLPQTKEVVEPAMVSAFPTMRSPKETLTSPGVTLGTVAYMSPEQARGEELDGRTDLFSFGAVLYEMATGRPAFSGSTSAVIFEAVLNKNPTAAVRLNPDLPVELDRIVQKALEKDRELRYQSAAEIRSDLRRLRRELDSGRTTTERTIPDITTTRTEFASEMRSHRRFRIGTFSVLLILVAGFLVYRFGINRPAAPTPVLTQISQWNKPILHPHLSPDGHAVAFNSPVGGVSQVFVMLTSGGEPLQLTQDQGDKHIDGFSVDGTEVFYHRSSGKDEEWKVPVLGGAPQKLVSGIGVVQSNDGQSYYYVKSYESRLFQCDRSGFQEKPVYRFDQPPRIPMYLLPDPGENSVIAATMKDLASMEVDLERIDTRTGTGKLLGTLTGAAGKVAWMDPGKSVIFPRRVNNLTNLWEYEFEKGIFTQITFGAGADVAGMPDPSGKGIYFVSGKLSGSLIAYDIEKGRTREITAELASQPILSPDGKRVMFVRLPQPGAVEEVRVSDVDGRNMVKLGTGRAMVTGDWSPDGTRVTFMEEGRGYVANADGHGVIPLRPLPATILSMPWSSDGKHLYPTLLKVGSPGLIWRLNADGSGAEAFMECCYVTEMVPGGKYLLGQVQTGEDTGIYQIDIERKECTRIVQGTATFLVRAAPDGKSILYALPGASELVIYRHLWADGKLVGEAEPVLKVPFTIPLVYYGNAYDFSRDLSTIVYAHRSGQDELFLMKLQD